MNPQPHMRNFFFSLCIWSLVAAGGFLAALGAIDYWQSRTAQTEIAREWESQESDTIVPKSVDSAPPSQTRGKPAPETGTTVAKLTIPRLKAVYYVVEGTDRHDLNRGPGHVIGTVLPGDDGNCVIAGHRDTHFSVLQNIRDGDDVILERGGRTFRYRVDEMSVVNPDNTGSLRPTKDSVLTLITCYPFHYIGSAPRRFIVRADLEDSSLRASR